MLRLNPISSPRMPSINSDPADYFYRVWNQKAAVACPLHTPLSPRSPTEDTTPGHTKSRLFLLTTKDEPHTLATDGNLQRIKDPTHLRSETTDAHAIDWSSIAAYRGVALIGSSSSGPPTSPLSTWFSFI